MGKDWIGDMNGVFKTIGSSVHTDHDRAEHDYYATEPKATELLLQLEKFSHEIWEPACGEGHIAKVLEAAGHDVSATDLIYRGYGEVEPYDFLKTDERNIKEDIVTNPPYKYAKEFVEKALDVVADGQKVAMFLKLTFLETKSRRTLFEKYPPKYIYVASKRLQCGMNGKFLTNNGGAVCYAWFIWVKGFKGEPVIRWFN